MSSIPGGSDVCFWVSLYLIDLSLMFRCTTSMTIIRVIVVIYYSGVVIGNNFYNDYYNLGVDFVNYFRDLFLVIIVLSVIVRSII